MQPLIERYPQTNFVILHASYPYTRDAGYLAAVYKNVYLDFGEVRISIRFCLFSFKFTVSNRCSPSSQARGSVTLFDRCWNSHPQTRFCGQVNIAVYRLIFFLTCANFAGDGHWWPESYYLGIYQARLALFEVSISRVVFDVHTLSQCQCCTGPG